MGGKGTLVVAGLAAPSAGALWAAVVLTMTFAVSAGIYQAPDVALALLFTVFVYAAIFCLVLTWTMGLAWHATAKRLGWTSFAAYVAAGTVMGLAISLLVASLTPAPAPTGAFVIVYFSSCATVVSATGWLIRRPDRDDTPPSSREREA